MLVLVLTLHSLSQKKTKMSTVPAELAVVLTDSVPEVSRANLFSHQSLLAAQRQAEAPQIATIPLTHKPAMDFMSYVEPWPATPYFASLDDMVVDCEPTSDVHICPITPVTPHNSPLPSTSINCPQTSNQVFHTSSDLLPATLNDSAAIMINDGIGHEQMIEDLTTMVEDDDTLKSIQEHTTQHARLELLICEHQKRLRQPKVTISDPKAASAILDLEILHCFNNRRHELQVKAQKQREKITNAPPKLRAALKAKTARIKPSTQAAKDITQDCNKGPYLGRQLCKMAARLLKTGELPENKQGMEASHPTLLN